MSWMTPNMQMDTSMEGGLGKAFGRAFSGESMFMNYYTCTAGEGLIAFASSFPGRIIPLQIAPGSSIVVQKSAFLAAEIGVQLSTFFTRKFSTGFFGGEGFIMQSFPARGWRSWRSTAMWWNTIWLPVVPADRYRPFGRHDRIGAHGGGDGQGAEKQGAGRRGLLQHAGDGPGPRLDQTMPVSKLAGLFPRPAVSRLHFLF